MKIFPENDNSRSILLNIFTATLALILYGVGVHFTIRADIGAAPWDVFSLGLSHTLGILYGTASIAVSLVILFIDILLREPIGIAMFIDALIVGKTVDLLEYLDLVPRPTNIVSSILMLLFGLTIMGYTQFMYMRCALGCGPRDTLMVALSKRLRRIPIGAVNIVILSAATLFGYLLGGPVNVGTLICAFGAGPIMQLAFTTMHFDAASVRHQWLATSLRVLRAKSTLPDNLRENGK